ncbi:LysM domain-containing protein, partial [Achromobacter denitrificans]
MRRWMGLLGIALLVLLTACGTTKVQPGYYRVQSGDTLTQIARKQGASVSDLVRWNKLSNANAIEVGQVLRVEPPAGQARAPAPSKATSRAQTSRPAT